MSQVDLITLTDPHSSLAPGETIRITPQNPIFFDADGNRVT